MGEPLLYTPPWPFALGVTGDIFSLWALTHPVADLSHSPMASVEVVERPSSAKDITEVGVVFGNIHRLLVYRTLNGRGIERENRRGWRRWSRQTWEAIWEALVAPLQDVSCTPGYLRNRR